MELKRRQKNIFPHTFSDIGAFIFVALMIPLTYWFEIIIVIPTLYADSIVWYYIHIAISTFLLINICGNFSAIILVDTSIIGEVLPAVLKPNWHFCAVCEAVAPPRAWHCDICKTCILKREHHCMFTGCCIGHKNHRFFLMFLFYMCIATAYCNYFNNFFLWQQKDIWTSLSLVKFIFPLLMLVTGMDFSLIQLYVFMYSVHLVGLLLTSFLLYYHFSMVQRGTVTYEANRKITKYNLGKMQNIQEVLGKQWYLTWILSHIRSELPHNGIEWDTQQTWKLEGTKSK